VKTGNSQGRLLAAWTDCFQSGPALRLLTYMYTHTSNRSCLCGGCAGSGGSVPNENQCELRGFYHTKPLYYVR